MFCSFIKVHCDYAKEKNMVCFSICSTSNCKRSREPITQIASFCFKSAILLSKFPTRNHYSKSLVQNQGNTIYLETKASVFSENPLVQAAVIVGFTVDDLADRLPDTPSVEQCNVHDVEIVKGQLPFGSER